MSNGTKKIGIVGGGSIGSTLSLIMAMAGSDFQVVNREPQHRPPEKHPLHERHQGAKERARRLKRLNGRAQ